MPRLPAFPAINIPNPTLDDDDDDDGVAATPSSQPTVRPSAPTQAEQDPQQPAYAPQYVAPTRSTAPAYSPPDREEDASTADEADYSEQENPFKSKTNPGLADAGAKEKNPWIESTRSGLDLVQTVTDAPETARKFSDTWKDSSGGVTGAVGEVGVDAQDLSNASKALNNIGTVAGSASAVLGTMSKINEGDAAGAMLSAGSVFQPGLSAAGTMRDDWRSGETATAGVLAVTCGAAAMVAGPKGCDAAVGAADLGKKTGYWIQDQMSDAETRRIQNAAAAAAQSATVGRATSAYDASAGGTDDWRSFTSGRDRLPSAFSADNQVTAPTSMSSDLSSATPIPRPP